MKKITLLVCILMAMFVNAQDDATTSDKLTFAKGTQLINGSITLNIGNSDVEGTTQTQESKNFGFSISPSYAYAISEDFFLGLGLGYGYNSRENELNGVTDSETKASSYNIFPYVRYYKGIGKKLAFYIQGEARYSYTNFEFNGVDGSTSNRFFIGVRPGITWMLNKNLGLETSIGALGYTTDKVENETTGTDVKTNNINFSLNSSNLLFGLSYYF
ncbi:hypothetical protein IMCC3317_26430 [Kordia antarctica]|uniref:Outer membrane protein beta-barrel domain-containing protein n=1 Tax=Kordia antarctica TaxID=1218801 RepID=A0A7L4ZMY7_9FLAO|nr:outer membrane beta-barrel protein [Kordia antarctica]QHI37264.1 hypothetical protein IMCC3317_26430 [Kordia antarctica]